MGNAVFRVCQFRDPLADFQKVAQLIMSGTPPHMQVLGSIGSKGVCQRMREIVTIRRLFFLLLGFMRLDRGRPLDRSLQLTAQMTRPGGHYVLFMVSLIRKIFSLFLPKNAKNCFTQYGNFEQL